MVDVMKSITIKGMYVAGLIWCRPAFPEMKEKIIVNSVKAK